MKQRLFSSLIIAALACVTHGFSEEKAGSDSGISELLALGVPAPDWEERLKEQKRTGWVPPPMPARTPLDSADAGKLLEYWNAENSQRKDKPSSQVREKLLGYVENHPALFEKVAVWFEPGHSDTTMRINSLYERLPDSSEEEKHIKSAIQGWLMTEAGLFREQLRTEAEDVFRQPDDDKKQAFFRAYSRLEPFSAVTMLLKHTASGNVEGRCMAWIEMYEIDGRSRDQQARAGKWRAELQKLVESDAAPKVRAKALAVLAKKEWQGQSEWILSLFKHAPLGEIEEDQHEEPLVAIVRAKPDFWVPKVIALVGSGERAAHDNAVRCLVQFHVQNKREDALRPLLPWLSNPGWALDEEHDGRLRLVQTLDMVNLPESVPGLLWVVDHDTEFLLSGAASALAHYKAFQAVPALRKSLEREADDFHQRRIVEALFSLNAFPTEEQALAIEAYERQMLTEEGRREWEDSKDIFSARPKARMLVSERALVSIGEGLLRSMTEKNDELAKAVVKQAANLHATNPGLSTALELRVCSWNTATSQALNIKRLREGKITAEWAAMLLTEGLLSHADLEALSDLPNNAASLVAVMLGDAARINSLLEKQDAVAHAMLLACARLARKPLPLTVVSKLLSSPHILCARAARLFLEAEDSEEARKLVWEQFRGEARILGPRMSYDPGHFSFRSLDSLEDKLRERVLAKDGPEEIYAMLSEGYWGNNGQLWIEVRDGDTFLINEEGGNRYRTRRMSREEFKQITDYVSKHRVNELPPLNQEVHDGIQYEYVHLSREGGSRVFMNNPGTAWESSDADAVYVVLVKLFRDMLEDESRLKVAYHAAEQIKGMRILVPSEQMTVHAVTERQGSLVLLGTLPGHDRDRWLSVDKLTAISDESLPVLRERNGGFSDQFYVMDNLLNAPWRVTLQGGLVRPAFRRKDDLDALWLCRKDREPVMMAKGKFASPLVSADGKWIVTARVLEQSWAEPNDVVRINAATHEVLPLRLAPADEYTPVTMLPESGKIVIHRVRDKPVPGIDPDQGPDKDEYHLLDTTTGSLERVKGEFGPLHDESWRPLQPTGEPGVVWAAIRSFDQGEVKGTQIGRYDMRRFLFTKVIEIPQLQISSMDFWVHEETVFLVVNGDLLSFPISTSR